MDNNRIESLNVDNDEEDSNEDQEKPRISLPLSFAAVAKRAKNLRNNN